MNAMNIPRAPRTLAEALDALQPFLPESRSVSINSYRHACLAGVVSVHVATGTSFADEITGQVNSRPGERLSETLFRAEAEHAAKWQAKHGKSAAGEAEFGAIFAAAVAA